VAKQKRLKRAAKKQDRRYLDFSNISFCKLTEQQIIDFWKHIRELIGDRTCNSISSTINLSGSLENLKFPAAHWIVLGLADLNVGRIIVTGYGVPTSDLEDRMSTRKFYFSDTNEILFWYFAAPPIAHNAL